MNKILLAIAAFFSTAEALMSFEEWVHAHGMPFKGEHAELGMRKAIFQKRVQEIIAHNSNPNRKYTMGLNKFSASTNEEIQSLNGAVPEMLFHHAPKNVMNLKGRKLKKVSDLPKNVDWREKGVVTPVKDQGQCGSCWAFSTTETFESHLAIQSGLLFQLSPQQIASCTENPGQCGGMGGCAGGMPQVAFDSLAQQGGLSEEWMYPYNSYYGKDFNCKALSDDSNTPTPSGTVDGYVQVTPNNYQELMNAVAEIGPVSIVVDASTWSRYQSGIFDGCDPENIKLDHAVQLVGYGEEENGDKYWIVRNSWSPAWGEKGYIRIKRTDDDDNVCDTTMNAGRCSDDPWRTQACGTCGIMYSPSYPTNAQLYTPDDKPLPHP
jgi:cathepsin L